MIDPAPILALLRAGKTITATAAESGVSVPTVRKIARAHGITVRIGPRPSPDMLPPAEVTARLDALANGRPRADLARAIGVSRQRLSKAERKGATLGTLEGWAAKIVSG